VVAPYYTSGGGKRGGRGEASTSSSLDIAEDISDSYLWVDCFNQEKGVIEEINNIKCDNVMTNATWLARPQWRGDDQLYGHEH